MMNGSDTLRASAFAPRKARRSLWHHMRLALLARRHRIQLAQLDATALNDMGISRSDVAKERSKPVWNVPQNWRF